MPKSKLRIPAGRWTPEAVAAFNAADAKDVFPTRATHMELQARLSAIEALMRGVDARVVATDGAIDDGDFSRELKDDEARAMYVLARGAPKRELARAIRRFLPVL